MNRNGLKVGYWEQYYNSGEFWYKGSYNSSLRYKGNYVNGLREGIWGFYTDNVLVGTILYNDDKII